MSDPRSAPAAATRLRRCERGAGNGDYRFRWKRRRHPQPALSRLAVAPAARPPGRRRQAFRAIDRDRRFEPEAAPRCRIRSGPATKMSRARSRIPVCLRSAKTTEGLLWLLGREAIHTAMMRENPSQIRSEMKEIMSGFPRSYARVFPAAGTVPAPSFPHSIRSPTGVNSSSPIIRVPFDGKSGAGRCSNDKSPND